MFKWLKRSTLDPLSVSMTGIKLADRVLVVGCYDPRFIAAMAAKSGLTGRACAVDESSDRTREAERVALAEGALIECAIAPFTQLPLNQEEFDLVVLRDVLRSIDPGKRLAVLSEAHRVLRLGGRCMVIDGAARAGVAAIFGSRTPGPATNAEAISSSLKQAGFVAVRTLAEREGLLFIEAIKRNS